MGYVSSQQMIYVSPWFFLPLHGFDDPWRNADFGSTTCPKANPPSVKASRVLHPLFCYIVQLTFELQIPWENPWVLLGVFFNHGKLASIAGKLRGMGLCIGTSEQSYGGWKKSG